MSRRHAMPPHTTYTDDWARIDALFPGSREAWEGSDRPAPRYYPVIRPPHLAIEDARCWSDAHRPDTCDCRLWDPARGTWTPWFRR